MFISLLHNQSIRFLAITAQFALLVLVIRAFELVSPNFGNLMVLAWGGFVVNHILPQRFRLPWFVLLSLVGLKLVAGGTVAVWVVACGVVLIGICHLPIPFIARVAVLLVAGGAISLMRIGHITPPVNTAAWIVLGSMFMFRTMSYLYELRHNTAPFSVSRALAYFFMLPNVCFVLFPLVDYRTFCQSHFNEEPEQLYTRGLNWMLRGIIHLLIYRLVYQLMIFSPLEATDLLSVVRFMLAAYLLYLKVSGWFHLIVGLLLMFGFNLPETHHFYLLASSFTDFWRRINIYWKDFLLKVFFYPAYFRLKSMGPTCAMALATLYAFFVTWLLHSYQFFWIRGEWLITWQDSLFWGILALLVVANALWEVRASHRHSLSAPTRNWKSGLTLALKTIGTFVVICSLWTLWSCKSWEELNWLVRAAGNAPWSQVAIVVAGLSALGLLGVWVGTSLAANARASRGEMPFWRSTALVTVSSASLLAFGLVSEAKLPAGSPASRALIAVKYEALNQLDLAQKRRGYYEELDVARIAKDVNFLMTKEPDPWGRRLRPLYTQSSDFMSRSLIPLGRVTYAGRTVTINKWGMRDRDYDKSKPNGVIRIALLGSSHEFGHGVDDEEVFEQLVESRLNATTAKEGNSQQYEILNFAVEGYTVFRNLHLLETKTVSFQPDAVFFAVSSMEEQLMLAHLSQILTRKYDCPYPIIQEVANKAGITTSMSLELIEARLTPYAHLLTRWGLEKFAEICRTHAIRPCLVYRPVASGPKGSDGEKDARFARKFRELGKELGLPVFDLTGAFGDESAGAFVNSMWDDHTNARGHERLADTLFELMTSPMGRDAWQTGESRRSSERQSTVLGKID